MQAGRGFTSERSNLAVTTRLGGGAVATAVAAACGTSLPGGFAAALPSGDFDLAAPFISGDLGRALPLLSDTAPGFCKLSATS